MLVIIIIISLICFFYIVFYYLLKRDIKAINQKLEVIMLSDTNMKLTTKTFDRNICELCNTINVFLYKQKMLFIAKEKEIKKFRQAITNVSHDLRTPLTSTLGYIQLLESEKTSSSKRSEYLQISRQRLVALSDLVNELFEYAQIVEGKTGINLAELNLCNFFPEVISDFYEEFEKKGFVVNIDIPKTAIFCFIDVDLLKRVTQNLVENVIIHGTEVFNFSISENNREIVFQNKVKYPEKINVKKLFDRFYTSGLSRSDGRAGLGLAIVSELMKVARGDLRAKLDGKMLSIIINLP